MTDHLPGPFAHLTRAQRRTLRADADRIATDVAKTAFYRPMGALPGTPAVPLVEPVARAAIQRITRRLLRDQTEAFRVELLTEAEGLAFPGERQARDADPSYTLACAMCALTGQGAPISIPALGANLNGDTILLWSFHIGGVPPAEVLLADMREKLQPKLDRLEATSFDAFAAGRVRT
jgi:hypothetical protein